MNEKNIDFKVYSSMVEHDYVWCDEKNLTRVLINLLGNAFKEDEEASKEAGMQAHIAKPIDINSMLDTIRDVLDRS